MRTNPRTMIARAALAAVTVATMVLLDGPPALALDQEPETKVIDCLLIDYRASCLECGADPGIYCCIKDLHTCEIKNPPPTDPPPPAGLRWTGFPTIRRGLGSSLYFTR